MNNLTAKEMDLKRKSVSEVYASALMECANDAIFVVSIEGKILNINGQAEKLLGLSREAIEGKFYHDFVVPDDHDYAVSEVGKIVGGNAVTHNEVRLRHSSGRNVFVEFSAVMIDLGDEKVMMSIGRDITEQKKTEEERIRLAAIVECSSDAIYAIDLEGIITVWNYGAEKLFDYAAQEVIGRDIFMLVPADRHAEMMKMIETCKKGIPLSHFETARKNRLQEKVPISVNWFPIRNEKGEMIGISAIARDLTEAKPEGLFRARE